MRYVVTVALIIVGVIHLLPLPGVLGPRRLEALYGVPMADRNLEILMRHRAVLFGILGAFFLFAAFRPELQVAAQAVGFVSVVSFLGLARSVGGYSWQVGRVYAADVVALLSLVVGALARLA